MPGGLGLATRTIGGFANQFDFNTNRLGQLFQRTATRHGTTPRDAHQSGVRDAREIRESTLGEVALAEVLEQQLAQVEGTIVRDVDRILRTGRQYA